MMKLSVVSTLYNSATHLKEFHERITSSVKKITNDYEIILVNDGSPDDSLDVALSIYNKDSKVKIVDLSRNFGHHKAMMTGLAQTKGDYVFLIDSDLEEEPELLGVFYNEMMSDPQLDVIYGTQEKREGTFIRKIGGSIFYIVYNFLSNTKIAKDVMMVRLMKKSYVNSLLQFRDKEPFFVGLCALAGFRQKAVPVTKPYKGKTSYDFLKRSALFLNAIISFSDRPLIYIFYIGIVISIVSGLSILWLLSKKILFNIGVEGWISIMISLWFLGGLVISMIGVVGLYMAKIFAEVKDRPITVIRDIYQKG